MVNRGFAGWGGEIVCYRTFSYRAATRVGLQVGGRSQQRFAGCGDEIVCYATFSYRAATRVGLQVGGRGQPRVCGVGWRNRVLQDLCVPGQQPALSYK